MNIRHILVALSLSLAGVPAAAQESIAVEDNELAAAITTAEERGQMLYAYDQAAWHATDALLEAVEAETIEDPRGYLVLPREGDSRLDTIFLREFDGEVREFARYTVEGSTVVSGGVTESEPSPLSPLAARMYAARQPAIDAMVAEKFGLCSKSSPNTLILPPDEQDRIAFYLLTSTTADDSYPLGGHYRADVAADGTVVDTRRYMNSCLDLPLTTAPGPDGQKGRPGVSYLLGDTPSEIHVFASYQFPDGLFVITSNNRKLWLVEKGSISLMQEDFGPE